MLSLSMMYGQTWKSTATSSDGSGNLKVLKNNSIITVKWLDSYGDVVTVEATCGNSVTKADNTTEITCACADGNYFKIELYEYEGMWSMKKIKGGDKNMYIRYYTELDTPVRGEGEFWGYANDRNMLTKQ